MDPELASRVLQSPFSDADTKEIRRCLRLGFIGVFSIHATHSKEEVCTLSNAPPSLSWA